MNTLRIVNVWSLLYSHDFVKDISNVFKNLTQGHSTHFKTEAILIQAVQGLKNALNKAFFKHENEKLEIKIFSFSLDKLARAIIAWLP